MMTLIERYLEALQAKIAEIAARPEPIRQAAQVCADALARGGVIHVFDSGHMVASELINRAGGLVAMSQLTFNLNVINPVKAPAGGISMTAVTPRSSMALMHRSQRTGLLTCVTRRRMTSRPSWMIRPSAFEIKGMRGSCVLIDLA